MLEDWAPSFIQPSGAMNPNGFGKTPQVIAECIISVPADARVLIAEKQASASSIHILWKNWLSLDFYTVRTGWKLVSWALQDLASQVQATLLYSQSEKRKLFINLLKSRNPRLLINTPAALGEQSVQRPGLFPAFTLGCGAVGGSTDISARSISFQYPSWQLTEQLSGLRQAENGGGRTKAVAQLTGSNEERTV